VVIYPTRTVDPGPHPHYHELLNSNRVTRVYLDEWALPRQTLSQQLMGVLLASSQTVINEAQLILEQMRNPEAIDRAFSTAIVNLIEAILVYKLPTLSREEIQIMLELTDVELKQTRFYQEVFTEGQQEGRQEGRQEEGVALILRLLHRRCGALTPTITEKIKQLDVPQLEALGEALLEFHTVTEVEQWLASRRQG
jgi:predicted transposase/invertase (TIGR01784 family)